MTKQDLAWKRALVLRDKFEELEYAVVERASNAMPGVPYNTPVKILGVSCVDSTMYVGFPYLSVKVELPNGEQRTISGEALCVGVDTEKKFLAFKQVYSL